VTDVSTEVPRVPFRGIHPFRFVDHPIFFARGEEAQRLTSLVSVYRGVFLYGDSGSGKSSLVNCGLLPEILAQRFQPERLRVQPRAGEELVVERIARSDDGRGVLPSVLAFDDDPSTRTVLSVDAFDERIQAASDAARPVLIFDQFEEIVTLFEDPESHTAQARLTGLFAAMLHGSLPVKVLFSFREDYLGKVKELLSECPELVDQALRIAAPAPEALPTIVRGPFERYPGQFAHELSRPLSDRLVTDLGEDFRAGKLSLSEVQTVCLRLWQSDDPEALLTEKGPQGLLEDYLGEALAEMPAQLRPAAIALLGQMVTSAGTRNVISAANLFQRVSDLDDAESPDVLAQALEQLSRSRLVRRERRRDLDLYEITSEFLVPWISRRRAELIRSRERRRERRRLMFAGGIAAASLLVAGVVAALAIWALSQRSAARDETRRAVSLALASDAQGTVKTRLDASLLLALAALAPYRGGSATPTIARSSMVGALETARSQGVTGILHGASGGAIAAVAFTRDGRTLATASDDGTVQLWDTATRTPRGPPLSAVGSAVYSVAFAPDGRTLAAGSYDGTVRLWNTQTRAPLGPPLRTDGQPINSVAFAPDGRTLAAGSYDGTLGLWNTQTRALLGPPLRTDGQPINSVAFAPDGRTLAAGSYDGTVRLWNIATRSQLGPALRQSSASVFAVAFSPDGRTLATGSQDGTVRLWNIATRSQLGPALRQSSASVFAVAFSPDGRTLAAGSYDGAVRFWNPETRQQLGGARSTGGSGVFSVAFAPDGRTLAAGCADGTVRLWLAPLATPPGSVLIAAKQVEAVAFSPNGRSLAAGSDDGVVRLWNPGTGALLSAPLHANRQSVYSLAFGSDGRTLVTGNEDGTIRWWDLETQTQLRPAIRADDQAINAVAVASDGDTVAAGGDDGTVRLWDLATGHQLTAPLRVNGGAVNSVALSPGARMLATASYDGAVRLWDLRTRQLLFSAPATGSVPADTVAFSPDGRILAAGRDDGTVQVWDTATPIQFGPILGVSTSRIYSLAFSPDGSMLAVGSSDGAVRLLDIPTYAQVGLPLQANGSGVNGVAFSPDGTMLAAGGADGTVRLWTGFSWPSFAALQRQVCGIVGHGLSRAEWAKFAPGISYQEGCG
jgi:WD40 repeat protein